jgi:hypothetical protein
LLLACSSPEETDRGARPSTCFTDGHETRRDSKKTEGFIRFLLQRQLKQCEPNP